MNTYYKFQPNVFLAKSTERYKKDDVIQVETKYGKKNESIIFNLIFQRDGFFYYSIVRADSYNIQERAKEKAERYQKWAQAAEDKSTKAWEASHEGRDFLALAEPIKVGHHSEKRHRALIERNHNRMTKSVELSNKAKAHEDKADYWKRKENEINLSMPESVEFYEYKLEQAKEYQEGLKSGKYERSHSFSLTYATKTVNDLTEKFALAKRLWE